MILPMSARAAMVEMERAVDPPSSDEQPMLDALDGHLARTLPPGRGAALEARGEFPDAELRAFAREGFVRELVPAAEGGCLDWARAMRLAARLSAHDLDVALCLGGAVLGGMPVLVAGDAPQRAQYFGALLRGEMGGLGLSEWDRGSDLLAIDTRAESLDAQGRLCAVEDAVRFRLFGTKSPVNNGVRGANVVVLARTGAAGDPFGASLFLVPRGSQGVKNGPTYAPMGFRGMDLSGITLDGAELPRSALLGSAGEGFAYARRALEISRSGVATMATGAQATCLALAVAHARSRVLYGREIGALGGVQAIVARTFARFAESLALSRRAVRAAARWPASARAWTAAAKLVCPGHLEQSVHDVGTLLGARSVLEDLPFARLRRAAPVLAIFDGSSQLQLDELWRYVARWRLEGAMTAADALARGRALRDDVGVTFDATREDASAELDRASPHELLHALDAVVPDAGLATLAGAARLVAAAAQEGRALGQATRFRVSSAAADLYAIAALAEVTALAHATSRDALASALALRVSDLAPSMAATLIALAPHVRRDLSGDAARILELARDPESTRAGLYECAVRIVP